MIHSYKEFSSRLSSQSDKLPSSGDSSGPGSFKSRPTSSVKLEKLTFEDENEFRKNQTKNQQENDHVNVEKNFKRDDSNASSIETDKDVDELVENLDCAIQKATENSKNEFDKKLGIILRLKSYTQY